MSCGFESNNHVAYFVQSLKRNSKLKSTVAVTFSGLQQSGIYAMNENCFIDADGKLLTDCGLVWINREMFIESDKLVSDDIVSTIALPLSTVPALEFYVSLKRCLNHNFLPGLLIVAGAVMSFHYRYVFWFSGLQQSGIYAMNENCFIDADGKLLTDCGLVWINREMFIESDKLVSDDIVSTIALPLSTVPALEFYVSLKRCLNHNFLPGLLIVAGAVMSFHYRAVIKKYQGCSVTIASGDSGTRKTTSIKAALSLCGINTMYSKGTNPGLLERSTQSTIPFGVDDPKPTSKSNQLDIGELCVDLYNGQKTINML